MKRIVFYDDGSYSGTQLVSMMQEYMGIKNKKTQEQHVHELSESGKEALEKKQILFFFFAFNPNSENRIMEDLMKLGLKDVSFAYIEDMGKRCLENGGRIQFKNEEQRNLVKTVLQNVGLSVINSQKMINTTAYKEGWDLERAEKAALGYNDSQQMVFLKSSVPTYTITAFWEEGKYGEFEWKPIFRRTKK